MRARGTRFSGVAALVLHLLLAAGASAQATITGRVLDATSGQAIVGADVSADGRTVLADAAGAFRLSVAAGHHNVSASMVGYAPDAVPVNVSDGASITIEIRLTEQAILLEGITATVTANRSDRTTVAPNATSSVDRREIEEQAVITPVDAIEGIEGIDIARTGINQVTAVSRGFNNVFSGSLLVLTDNRYARMPSLRFNAYNMIPSTPLDIERIEVVKGPASALYGPNSANGVMHLITSSPIDRPGTTLSLAGGDRSIFNGAFRQAFRFSDRVGLKVSGQYFRGDDFESTDAAEVPDPGNPRVGARDFASEKWGGEARLDIRPWEGSTDGITATYGYNMLANSVEMTGIGAAQGKDWKYEFGQLQLRRGGFYAQTFLNRSDAGDTYLLRTGAQLVDSSTVFAAQVQQAFSVGSALDLVVGGDLIRTTPKTGGTITGANEDNDGSRELGGYLSATVPLGERLDLVGAIRIDDHEHLPDPVWSPRLGLVAEPAVGHKLRATYNRAFSTPTQNNLFLDLVAGRIPVGPVGYDVRTTGVPPATGYTWNDRCPGGAMDYCMYSPFAPGVQLPATGTVFWDDLFVPTALQDPDLQNVLQQLGITPDEFAAIVGAPTPAEMASTFLRFNAGDPSIPFVTDPGVMDVGPIAPTITTSYEIGYDGYFGGKARVSASLYRNQIRDFVGPLRVETPTVFLDGASVASFVATRLVNAGVPVSVATDIGAGIAPGSAIVPVGTVAPDQRSDSDLVLTYRNFGEVSFWGADIGFEAHATPRLTLTGSYSWVSEECFDFNDDGDCTSARDIALNAPTDKGSLGFRFADPGSGFGFGGSVRMSGAFPMNSGVYLGDVDAFTVVDANVAYRVPGYDGFIVSATVQNLLDSHHQEFVGAPRLGRIALLKVQYSFGTSGVATGR